MKVSATRGNQTAFLKISSRLPSLVTHGPVLGGTLILRNRLASLTSSVLLVAAALLAVPSVARAETWAVPTRDQITTDVTSQTLPLEMFETALMMTINEARVAHGRAPIVLFDSCTDRFAERWGRHIAGSGVFAHRDQNQVNRRCGTSWAGEALIRGTLLTPRSMVDLWMDSPPHREILLSPRARRAGVAVVPDAQGRLVGVLNLTRPGPRP